MQLPAYASFKVLKPFFTSYKGVLWQNVSNTRFRNEIFLSNDCIEESFFGFIVFLIVSDTKQTFWNVVDVNEAQSADQRALIHMLCGRHVK
jgi:hypothetical protein